MTATVNATPREYAPERAYSRGQDQDEGTPRRRDLAGLGLAGFSGVAFAWLSFQLVLAVILAAGRMASDAPAYSIANGSMEPNLPVGAIIINTAVDPNGTVPEEDLPDLSNLPPEADDIGELSLGNIKLFDVVSFDDPASPGRIITHRVVRIANGTFVTKGDANQDPDSTPVPFAAVQGKGRMAVPIVGMPAVWLEDSNYLPLVIWGGTLLAAAALIVIERDRHRKTELAMAAAEDDEFAFDEWDHPTSTMPPVPPAPPTTAPPHAPTATNAFMAGFEPPPAAPEFEPDPVPAEMAARMHSGYGVTVPIVITMPHVAGDGSGANESSTTTVPILVTVPNAATVSTLPAVSTRLSTPESDSEEWISFPDGWGSGLEGAPPELP